MELEVQEKSEEEVAQIRRWLESPKHITYKLWLTLSQNTILQRFYSISWKTGDNDQATNWER